MKVGYLDMFSGVSGDMLLGACLDAGVPLAELREALAPLELNGVRLDAERIERHGIAATRCRVVVPDSAAARHLPEILDRIGTAALPGRVTERATAVFRRLAAAEAAVHGITPEEVHFHEVGALDAIVDVVGGAWCLDRLGLERLHASRFTLGRGWTEAAHGRMPVPPPAVLELVRGWEVEDGGVEAELTTPTGAALVTTLASGRGMPPSFVPEATGYGAGARDLDDRPNLLRLVVGWVEEGVVEGLAIVETDLDDLSPQLFEPLAEGLYRAGAREVHWTAVQMKKQRPGTTVRILAPIDRVPELGRTLFRETTTLGYRWWPVRREILAREAATARTRWGEVRVKRIRRPDGKVEIRPEYEACRRIAAETGLPVREVMAAIAADLGPPRDDGLEPTPEWAV
ncbi:MAG TPA: nickel pincer cofactor biosynthesis protein LarC [Gemmatimonadota bacterium]|nr:nickel pincer cofactor biosynthesis protein LarC [Gemmatimonadota bacterium]